jgi:hypothetical protein
MKSPFADAVLKHEPATVKFRGEEYSYVYSYYVGQDGQRYTTTEIDEENVRQVYNQYREKYGIPSPEEIAGVKERYGLSNAKLAAILGFGENQIANYLDGEVPSLSNGRTLAAVRNPVVMEVYVDNARGQIGEKTYDKIKGRIALMKETVAEAV